MSIRTETSLGGGNFTIIEYDDDRHRRIVELRSDGSVSIGSQFRTDRNDDWVWYQDEGATLQPDEMAELVKAYNASWPPPPCAAGGEEET